MSSSSSSSSGIGFGGALCIVFIILRLCNIIQWSWWWVCSPLLIPLVLFSIAALIVLAIVLYRNR